MYPGQTRRRKGVRDALFSCAERDTNVNIYQRVEIEKNGGSGILEMPKAKIIEPISATFLENL